MIVALVGVSLLLELLLIPITKRNLDSSKFFALLSVVFTSFTTTILFFNYPSFINGVFAFISIFRIFNVSRIAIGRMNAKELQEKYKRSSLYLLLVTSALLYVSVSEINFINLEIILYLSLAGSLVLLLSTIYSSVKWRPRKLSVTNDLKQPTVSICIPARNETQDLPECIESMLDSNYSKLEILVLDDCSHDKTPAIIKEYAHKGVRFVSGTEPDDDWLAKNQAMNKLFDEAKGEIIIFTGVDVRFSKNSVQQIVNTMQEGSDMLSVLPRRSFNSELSVFIQPLRYWWELSVPRFLGGRPPVLSTCWAIRSASLKKLGEFDSFRKSVQPEAHFAKRLKSKFSFIMSGNRLGIVSVKPAREQYNTAIRTRYPQAKRRIELVPVLLVAEVTVFFTPIVGIINGIVTDNSRILLVSIVSMSILVLINTYISFITVYRTWLFGLVTLPFLLFEEWFILIRSMLAYEFGVVMWKDRNICLPMYKVEKTLPKL